MRLANLHSNSLLLEVAGDRPDIMAIAEQIQNAAIDCALLLEAPQTLTPDQISQLFTNVESISKGQKPPGKFKQAGQAVSNLMGVVNKAATQLQNTAPVQAFDQKIEKILGTYAEKLGPDHNVVKMARTVGEFAKNNPKKTAFAIAALTGLAGALGTPGAGAAVGAALRGTVGLMKGEKASTVVGKAGAMAAGGAAVGGIADALGIGADVVAQAGLDDLGKPFGQTEMADMIKNDLAYGSLQPNNIGSNWEKYARMAYKDEVATMKLSPLQQQHIYGKIGLQMKRSLLQATGTQNWQGGAAEFGELVKKALGESEEFPLLAEIFGFGKKAGVNAAGLSQAWEKAGKPTDVASIQKILTQAGVNAQTIQSAMQSLRGTQAPQAAAKPNLVKNLQRLDDQTFKELFQQLNAMQA